MRALTVALAQTSPVIGDVATNAETAVGLVESAAAGGARLVLFPELSLIGYDLDILGDPDVWLASLDPRLDGLRAASREHGVAAVVGAAFRDEDGTPLPTSLALLPDGRILVYGKHFLHGRERALFHPGRRMTVLEIDDWRVALAVCYDAGVPAHAQAAASLDADVYAASVLYAEDETRRFDIHLAARAMDHRMYALAANHAGKGQNWTSCGSSGVWHPDGRRLLAAGGAPELVLATLDRAQLRALRDKDAAAGYPR